MDYSSSDRSSTSSGSPQSSPLQHQVQPSTAYPHAATYANMFHNMHVKYQQPPALPPKQRFAIPIVNPNTGLRVASPPLASPNRNPYPNSGLAARRWWDQSRPWQTNLFDQSVLEVMLISPILLKAAFKKNSLPSPAFSLISDYILAMSIECWCLPVLFLGVCQINHGMVLLCSLQRVLLWVRSVLSFIFASGLFKKSGENEKYWTAL